MFSAIYTIYHLNIQFSTFFYVLLYVTLKFFEERISTLIAAKASYAATLDPDGIGVWEFSQNQIGELLRSGREALLVE